MTQRIIKFRAWFKPLKRMLNVKELQFKRDGSIIILTNHTGGTYPNSYEIMQFTGLKDRNGKEVYGGDILKDKLGSIAVVHFSNGEFTLMMDCKELTKQIMTKADEDKFERESCFRDYEEYNKWYDCEVIGNRYENLDLIKEAKE